MKKANKMMIAGLAAAAIALAGMLIIKRRNRRNAISNTPVADHRPQTIIRHVMHKSKEASS